MASGLEGLSQNENRMNYECTSTRVLKWSPAEMVTRIARFQTLSRDHASVQDPVKVPKFGGRKSTNFRFFA